MDAIDRMNANHKAYRDRLHARGLCIRCRQPLEPERAGVLLCAACAAHSRDLRRARYHRLKDKGLCVVCGRNKTDTGRVKCRTCLLDAAERDHRRYWEAKQR